jgi:dUTP pyrophosphatase
MEFSEFDVARKTINSAGYDFKCPYNIDIHPGEWVKINLGVKLTDDDCPITTLASPRPDLGEDVYEEKEYVCRKWVMLLFPRSSLGMRYGLRFSNTVGVIDMDYRNNIFVDVTADTEFTLKKGERFCQGIIVPFATFEDELVPTEERHGGMGSTGNF